MRKFLRSFTIAIFALLVSFPAVAKDFNLDIDLKGVLNLGAAGVRMSGDGDGAITWLSLGNGSGGLESLTLNLDDTANTGTFTSSSGLNLLNFSSISLQESGNNVLSDAEIDTSSELAAILTDESGSSGGTVVFSNNPTLLLDWDNIWGDAVHSHQSNAEGGSLDAAAITSGVLGEANGGTGTIKGVPAGQVLNCGMSVSGSTFTISSQTGASLSASSLCKVGVKSNTSGLIVSAPFSSDVTFTFGAASNTDSNLFGITDADWSSTMPFFVGVLYDGSTPYFTISRLPLSESGGSVGLICQKNDTDCDGERDIMILTTGLTLSSFLNLPITQVGWFNMTYATSGAAWTAVVTSTNGFNKEYKRQQFTMPTLQNGATSDHCFSSAGTLPDFTSTTETYYIDEDGEVTVYFTAGGDAGTDGSGANAFGFALPFDDANGVSTRPLGFVQVDLPSSVTYYGFIQVTNTANIMNFNYPGVSGTALQNSPHTLNLNDFTNGTRNLVGSLKYHTLVE